VRRLGGAFRFLDHGAIPGGLSLPTVEKRRQGGALQGGACCPEVRVISWIGFRQPEEDPRNNTKAPTKNTRRFKRAYNFSPASTA